ncbi:hypothetical protein [Mycolicibacterium sp. 120270]|uniref:hypothetical protein n=1 Tax=Mycolicibacterium sp. 120270 TaxID=3090600 RepID=UPI00299F0104|nr:hypothetical protein [Mycolicibacterium sp. 120270]MDX1886922.1 hypothetical protein [Mycolicibacterium sp. 120270]
MAASSHGGAGNGPTPTATRTDAAHSHLAALLAQGRELDELIARAAVKVVSAWLIDTGRSWLAVDVSRSLPDYPLDTNEALADAVRHLPNAVFCWGLDIRGQYAVRLFDLATYLQRERGNRSHTTTTTENRENQ